MRLTGIVAVVAVSAPLLASCGSDYSKKPGVITTLRGCCGGVLEAVINNPPPHQRSETVSTPHLLNCKSFVPEDVRP
jgi:hypothetical protein